MRGRTLFIAVIIALAVLSAVASPFIYEGVMRFIYPLEHEDIVSKYADEYGLDTYMVLGLIKAESNFVTDAESHQGAKGLMQLTEATAIWVADEVGLDGFDVSHLSDPETNIMLGCWYLDYLIDAYEGDLTLALCAYNAGSGNVAKWLANEKYSKDGEKLDEIPFAETKNYVVKTKEYSERYKEMYPDI